MQNPVQLRKKHSCSNWLQVHRNHFPLHQTWVRLCLSRANSQLPGPLANCNLKKKLMLFAAHTHSLFQHDDAADEYHDDEKTAQLLAYHLLHQWPHVDTMRVSAAINGIKNGKHVQRNAAFDCQNPKPPLRFTPGLSAMLRVSTKYFSSRLPWGNWNQISGWRW